MTSELPLTARPGVFCEEKILLMANYGAAAAAYCVSVAKLEQGIIRGSRETYAELRCSLETARRTCEAALGNLTTTCQRIAADPRRECSALEFSLSEPRRVRMVLQVLASW
jgi:hypothetical protein